MARPKPRPKPTAAAVRNRANEIRAQLWGKQMGGAPDAAKQAASLKAFFDALNADPAGAAKFSTWVSGKGGQRLVAATNQAAMDQINRKAGQSQRRVLAPAVSRAQGRLDNAGSDAGRERYQKRVDFLNTRMKTTFRNSSGGPAAGPTPKALSDYRGWLNSYKNDYAPDMGDREFAAWKKRRLVEYRATGKTHRDY